MLPAKHVYVENNILDTALDAKFPKSPLRYPGGKSRAVKQILRFIPQDIDTLVSPFLGGGSVELALASLRVQVLAYDIFEPLVAFWQELIEDKRMLSVRVKSYWPLHKEEFYALQKKQTFVSKAEQATIFYVLNRASFSGSTLSGGMSPGHPRFTINSILYLKEVNTENMKVEQADFKDSILKHKNEFMYLDPPYMIKQGLYGKRGDAHKDFDHLALYDLLKDRKNWLLSYNNCAEIRELYQDFPIVEPQWAYGMSANKKSKELLILSKDLKLKEGKNL